MLFLRANASLKLSQTGMANILHTLYCKIDDMKTYNLLYRCCLCHMLTNRGWSPVSTTARFPKFFGKGNKDRIQNELLNIDVAKERLPNVLQRIRMYVYCCYRMLSEDFWSARDTF